MTVRRLTLKREVLQELGSDELAAIAGAAPPNTTEYAETMYSCLHYISCYIPQCIVLRPTLVPCIIATD
jgi:hypothetical protein